MMILGIDPGTTTTGFALIEKEGKHMRVVEYGTISLPSSKNLSDMLLLLARDLSELLDTYRPDVVGIERLFFFRNVTNGIEVAQARGVVLYTIASRGIPIREFTPLQVKKAVTGNGHAKKLQIQRAIALIF